MNNVDTKVLDRIKKLLELGTSDNVNEATNALAQAQKLMNRHKISQAMLTDFDIDVGGITDEVFHSVGQRVTSWKSILANVLARFNQCSAYCDRRGGEIRIVGHQANVETARYFFNYIALEIARACKTAQARQVLMTRGEGKTWANNFKIGAVEGVEEALELVHKQARAEARWDAANSDTLGNGKALVRVNNAIAKIAQQTFDVDAWIKENLKLKSSRMNSRFVEDAYALGVEAGKSIDVSNRSKGTLEPGDRKVLT